MQRKETLFRGRLRTGGPLRAACKVKSTLHRQESIFRHLDLPLPKHLSIVVCTFCAFHITTSTPYCSVEAYFVQDDHVPRQSCPEHCPSTLHRITMNLCNVALLLLRLPLRTSDTFPDAAGLREGGGLREPPGGGEQADPGSPLERIPSGRAPQQHPYPRKSGRTKISKVDEGELDQLLLLVELEEHGECFQRSQLQLEVRVVLGWAKYSYLARTLDNFTGDQSQGVQSCTGALLVTSVSAAAAARGADQRRMLWRGGSARRQCTAAARGWIRAERRALEDRRGRPSSFSMVAAATSREWVPFAEAKNCEQKAT
jgi:hypothetical protein